ncbi:DNA adenine methylase [Dongia sp.]|uniref:DNA adenine methylase n=1 Tax=Dongia sp. TaxID=1977262 RepID=UPI0035B18518
MDSNSHRPVSPVDPIAPWLGGKRHLAQHIAGLIGGIPHVTYVEPFIGMAGVFLRRPHAAPAEVINDINRDLVTLYRVAQRHPAALAECFNQWILASRLAFDQAKVTPPEILTDVERAARFLYLQRLGFGGKPRSPTFGVDPKNGSRLRLRQLIRQIDVLHRRLEDVTIECLPWFEVIARYDQPGTLFYLDPPYWGGESDYGKDIFARRDFTRLAEVLRGIEGRFILSINDVPEVRTLFAGFAIAEHRVTYTIGRHAATESPELIVTDGKGASAGPLFG